jgi:hypothetical protein
VSPTHAAPLVSRRGRVLPSFDASLEMFAEGWSEERLSSTA